MGEAIARPIGTPIEDQEDRELDEVDQAACDRRATDHAAWLASPEKALADVRRARRGDYPAAGDQLDQLWKWAMAAGLVADTGPGRDLNTPEGMAGEILDVKSRHPKPA